jgi:lactoylglutathione lyase
MPRIVHIALKVPDLEKGTKFYATVFGFKETKTSYDRGHVSRNMTDGNLDLALMVYDSEDVEEAKLSGPGPCIHHWGIEVDDRDATAAQIEAGGGKIISREEGNAWKFRAPDGTVAEIVKAGRYKKKPEGAGA